MPRLIPSSSTPSFGLLALCLCALVLTGCDLLGTGSDSRAPVITIDRPGDGASVSGANVLINMSAEAVSGTDNFISFINVNLDGALIGNAELIESGNPAQFAFRWNTFNTPDGEYVIEAAAFDKFDSRGISAPIRVRVANQSLGEGPQIEIVSPSDGDTLSATTVRILASEPLGESKSTTQVDFLIDGVTVFTATDRTFQDAFVYDWPANQETAGLHVIEAKAYSDADVFRLSAPISVVITSEDTDDGGDDVGDNKFKDFKFSLISGEVDGSIAIGFNNDLYVGTTSDTLYAFRPSGEPKWNFGTQGPIRSSPVVANNDDVFVTSEDGRLYGFTASGTELWSPYDTGALLRASPAIGIDATLYFGDSEGRLHAVNPFNGQSLSGWPIELSDSPINAPPVINEDGRIFVASTDGFVYYVDEDLTTMQSPKSIGSITTSMALAEIEFEGVINQTVPVVYVVSSENKICSFDGRDLTFQWGETEEDACFDLSGPITTGPVVDTGGTIYIGTSTGLTAIDNNDGAPKLRFIFPAEDVGMPAIDSGGSIYFTSAEALISVNANSTKNWERNVGAHTDGPLTISRAGTILFFGDNGLLYGFESGSTGLASGQWPMFQRNSRHTGREGNDASDG